MWKRGEPRASSDERFRRIRGALPDHGRTRNDAWACLLRVLNATTHFGLGNCSRNTYDSTTVLKDGWLRFRGHPTAQRIPHPNSDPWPDATVLRSRRKGRNCDCSWATADHTTPLPRHHQICPAPSASRLATHLYQETPHPLPQLPHHLTLFSATFTASAYPREIQFPIRIQNFLSLRLPRLHPPSEN